jgi:hypothetical protein
VATGPKTVCSAWATCGIVGSGHLLVVILRVAPTPKDAPAGSGCHPTALA